MAILQCIVGIFHWICGAATRSTQANSPGVDKNHTVNQLWPGENKNVEPNSTTLTLIFFHGLQLKGGTSPWRTTWKVRNTNECWPQKWLPEDLLKKGIENVRVLSLSYDSIASRWGAGGRTRNVSHIGKNLVHKLICNPDWRLDEHQRIVLVGHSCGGLVIKSMIVEAQNRLMKSEMVPGASTSKKVLTERMDSQCREFLKHIRHIIFYGVPNLGTDVARYVKAVDSFSSLRLAGFVYNLKPFDDDMEELSKNFQFAISQRSIPIFAIAETQEYMKVMVVEKVSAQHLANEAMELDADHVDICKPIDKEDDGYKRVVHILALIMGGADDCCDTGSAPRSSVHLSDADYGTPRSSVRGSETDYGTPGSSVHYSDTAYATPRSF